MTNQVNEATIKLDHCIARQSFNYQPEFVSGTFVETSDEKLVEVSVKDLKPHPPHEEPVTD